jgi:hypothetical protein
MCVVCHFKQFFIEHSSWKKEQYFTLVCNTNNAKLSDSRLSAGEKVSHNNMYC